MSYFQYVNIINIVKALIVISIPIDYVYSPDALQTIES